MKFYLRDIDNETHIPDFFCRDQRQYIFHPYPVIQFHQFTVFHSNQY